MADPQILVVGAGATGLMLACELARRGLQPRIVDKAAGPDLRSRAVGIHARTLEVLDELGLARQMDAEGLRVQTLDVRHGPELRARLDFALADSVHTYAIDLPQHRTEALLRDKLTELGVAVEWGTELVGLHVNPDGVDVELRRHSETETAAFGWVCGCDGVRSTVRTLAGVAFEGADDPEGWALVEATVDWELSPDSWHVFMGEEGVLVACALPGGGYRLAANVEQVAGDDPAPPTRDEFQRVLEQRAGPGRRIRDITWASPFRIHERMASTFRRGPVLLAGDSAHVQSPSAAQGLNTGVQDAWNLGWKLALVARGVGSEDLLASYNVERQQIARGSISFTHVFTRLGELQGPGADLLRASAERVGRRVPGLFRYLIDRMAEVHLHYRDSPIVAEHLHAFPLPRHAIRAGDRLPDVALPAAAQRLHVLLRGRDHVLLQLDGAHPTPPDGSLLRDVSHVALAGADAQSIAVRCGWPASTWVVVRPDRYIGYLGHSGGRDSLSRYLARTFAS